jgi:lipoate-protein ligase A
MTTTFRLIIDPPRPAALNMAIDELLTRRASGGCAPTLRFYRWQTPAVTVGYFEDVARSAARFHASERGFPVVRRITGGGAVRHGADLTFSLILNVPTRYFSSDVKSSYLKINEAVRVGLREDHPSLDYADCRSAPSQSAKQKGRVCFESPSCYDLLLAGRKVLGGSQRRTRGVMLHQSTLFLPDAPELLEQKIREGFERVWKIRFLEEPLTEKELDEAAESEKAKRADARWTYLPKDSLLREAIFLS